MGAVPAETTAIADGSVPSFLPSLLTYETRVQSKIHSHANLAAASCYVQMLARAARARAAFGIMAKCVCTQTVLGRLCLDVAQ